MLLMQIAQRLRNGNATLHHLVQRKPLVQHPPQECRARHILHHDVRLHREVAVRDPSRHMRAFQLRHDHLLDLEADQ